MVSTQSIVARAGASMAAPLAMPPIAYDGPRRHASLGTVSVVLMASAAAAPPPPLSADAAAFSTAGSSSSIGSRSPISPVEQTATWPAAAEIAPASRSAVSRVSSSPAGPVHAFAPPEFSTTARTWPARVTCSVQRTGAALTRLEVKTAAAACDGPSLSTTATSGSPEAFSPAVTPAARKPRGAVMLMVLLRR